MSERIFICYSTHDVEVAVSVRDQLEANGFLCWMAPRDIEGGGLWATEIRNAISTCSTVVLFLSANSNKSSEVIKELELATSAKKTIVPFRIDTFTPSDALEYFLSEFPPIEAISPPITQHVESLLFLLRYLVPKTDSATSRWIKKPRPLHRSDGPDVFISYRRKDGAQTARLIRTELRQQGFNVFLDVDDLRPGHYDEALLAKIEFAPHFVVVLTPDCLNRCTDEDDWLRKEIAHAIQTRRNIIPVMMPGFSFSNRVELPADIQLLQKHHGISYSHEFFEAMISKLVKYIENQDSDF